MKVFLFLVLGGVLAGGAYFFLPQQLDDVSAGEEKFEDTIFEVRRGDLDIVISENGYLNSKNQVELKPQYRGQNVITFLIDEGTEVKEGELLAEFDSTDLQSKLEEAQNTLIQYETELEAATANLEIQRRDNEAAIEKAQLDVEISALTLKRFEEGEVPNTKRKNQLAVEKAESEHQRTKDKYDQVPELLSEGFLTPIQAEEERIRLREAEINLENALEEQELYETYTQPMEVRQKKADEANAIRALETAKDKAKINIKEKEAQVSQKDRLVKSTKSLIEKTQRDLEKMKLIAPQPGIVLHGNPKREWERDQIKVGATVWQGWTVITLPDLSEMQVQVNIHEADIDDLAVGQEAVITLDTYKGRTFTGEVAEVASVANSSNWTDSTNKQFRVEILLKDLDVELRSGITAKVEIKIDRLEDVLYVPIHCVFAEGEDYFCFVPDQGGFKRIDVTVGSNNSHYVEVESGLEEGQSVLLYDPRDEGLVESADEEDGESPADALSGAGAED